MKSYAKHLKETIQNDPKFEALYKEELITTKAEMIGELIKEARKQAGLTQEKLAKKMNTKRPAISRLEHHAEDSRVSTLFALSEALGKELVIGFKDREPLKKPPKVLV
jgi:HTH-type transcriptional regulator/antitoxin HipB